MKVINRAGEYEPINFDLIYKRIHRVAGRVKSKSNGGASPMRVDAALITKKVIQQTVDGIETRELDRLSAEVAIQMSTEHPDYETLAAHLAISSVHKDVRDTFSVLTRKLHARGLVSDEHAERVERHAAFLDAMVDYERDFALDFFGFRTLQKGYLLRVSDTVHERPQDMFARVALHIHEDDLEKVAASYDAFASLECTHASPTLFNAGTARPQLASCFLMGLDDSIDGIYENLGDVARISKTAGGIGIHMNNVRSNGSYIRGTGGTSSGLIPMLRVYNQTARYVNQGGKRLGSIAIYLSPTHPDFLDFVELRKNFGNEEARCRDLFLAAWIPDLFMRRVEADETWSFLDPDECPGLDDVFGDAFDALYERYVSEGKARATMRARDVWNRMINAQIETGTPYVLFKDAANRKSNQKHYGTIRSSNLCSEIMEYSDAHEHAVCNLGSIALSRCVKKTRKRAVFDFEKLGRLAALMVENLDKVIDRTFYPTDKTRRSNERHRPIGLGVQGLADAFQMLDVPFDSPEAQALNRRIFATIYYHAMRTSVERARTHGAYPTFEGSPFSKGQLQFDLWDVDPGTDFDWEALREEAKSGVRNSLLTTVMPTASTGQILGNNECIEPYTSNLYTRRTLAGEFIVLNKHLLRRLIDLELWTPALRNRVIQAKGSVQAIEEVPEHVRSVFRTVWEIKQKVLIDGAADRGAFVDQSQSLNLFFARPNHTTLSSALFYGWKRGLKTGMYYLRSLPVADAVNITTRNAPACDSCSG